MSTSGVTATPPTAATPTKERQRWSEWARQWWRRVEDAWLDPTALPLADRIERDRWEPDAATAFCNRCGQTVGPFEADEFGCVACRDRRLPWDQFVRVGEYLPPLDDWIVEVKFHRFRTFGDELGRLLGQRIAFSRCVTDPASTVVVPVPTTWQRRLERGIDHAGVIAAAAARELDLPVRRPLSRRHRPSQRAVSPGQRARNVAGSFSLTPRAAAGLRGKTVILIDDVMTTGATLRAASRALKSLRKTGNAPARIVAAVLAVTPPPDRRPAEKTGSGGEYT